MRRRAAVGIFFTLLVLATLPTCGTAQQRHPHGGESVALRKVGNFESPTYVAGAPGFPKLLFVVEQPGTVRVLREGHELGQPFLDISGLVGVGGEGDERGLLSIAFPPDYAHSRRFYVYYTDNEGNIRIGEFKRRTATQAARGTGRTVIEIPHPTYANHDGGQLQVLGNLLYFATGDGGLGGDPRNNAQNRNSLLGKLLRIDPRQSDGQPYSVPADNPFVGRPGRDEIYSYGLRNPFRFSFDTTSAKQPRIAIGDVGQNQFEELDYTTVTGASGANFGWDALEGFNHYEDLNSGTPDPGGTTKPIMAYSHSRDGGSCAIIGGYVMSDPALPSLRGRYVYSDYCSGRLYSLSPRLRRASGNRPLGPKVDLPTSFGEDDRGRIYITSQEGPVYRLVGH